MLRASFPSCCGAHIIHGIEKNYRETDEHFIKRLIEKSSLNGLCLLILNAGQIDAYHDLILKAGYRVLLEGFYNPNEGTMLTLYGSQSHPQNERKKKILKKKL